MELLYRRSRTEKESINNKTLDEKCNTLYTRAYEPLRITILGHKNQSLNVSRQQMYDYFCVCKKQILFHSFPVEPHF